MAGWGAVESDIRALVEGYSSGPEAHRIAAEFAASKRDEVVARDQPSSVRTYVDGREGAALESVKLPGGTIRFEFSYTREVVAEILNMLIAASPYRDKRPGANPATHYKDQHLIFVNGTETDDITNLPPDAVVVFVNLQPYSRKVERGFSMQAPSGVYQMVARQARSMFGKVVSVEFGYDIFPNAGPSLKNSVRGHAAKARRDDRFPTITVRPAS